MGLTSSSRDDTASLSPTHAADGSDRSIMLIFPSCKNGERDKNGSRSRGHPAPAQFAKWPCCDAMNGLPFAHEL
jgi:hypothetical protein